MEKAWLFNKPFGCCVSPQPIIHPRDPEECARARRGRFAGLSKTPQQSKAQSKRDQTSHDGKLHENVARLDSRRRGQAALKFKGTG